MSDTFNPLHYLDLKYLNEKPQEKSNFNLNDFIINRKKIFIDFKFIIIKNKDILYSDFPVTIDLNKQFIFNEVSNIFLISIHENDFINENNFCIENNSIFIHEDISLQTSKSKTYYIVNKCKEFYHFDNHQNNQFFYNKITFDINNSLTSYFLTMNNNQKQKNEIIYNLNDDAIINHFSFVDIQKGQLQDDSIEVLHNNKSSSFISYDSINKGKISSQLNSVIFKDSINCSTKQKIQHFVLDKNAITNSKPNLIIKNPNVIASHGNSIGGFNSDDLFYLKLKGLTQEQSEIILSKSKFDYFFESSPILNQIKLMKGLL